jgi:UDP-N-acetylmuramate dehydrogenase
LISIAEIRKIFRGRILLNEPLNRFTTFRIGGAADYYVEPVDEQDVLNIINYVNRQDIPFYVIGNGSNILISDEGIRGVVINLEKAFSHLLHRDGKIISGSGVKIAKFADFVINNGYEGVEMLAGIPATLGGALVMNAGAYGGEISEYVESVKAVRDNEVRILSKVECGFNYRSSALKNSVVLEATFIFPKGDRDSLIRKRKELLLRRNMSQPVEIPNAGCIFKNPENEFAARLIEQCGLKGLSYGGAKVSEKHANFIVNYNNAKASDVVELIKIIRKTVRQKTGIELNLEVKFVGFQEVMI